MNQRTLTQLRQFQAALYHTFMHRTDAVFELVDAPRVHQPRPIRGNKPVTISHDYTVIGQIDLGSWDSWLAVLDVQRIATSLTPAEVRLSQFMEREKGCPGRGLNLRKS